MRFGVVLFVLAFLPAAVLAHVGNPDVYFEGNAGAYKLYVTLRPPVVVPGVTEIEVRSTDPGLKSIRVVPVPLNPGGAKFSPVPDYLVSDQDHSFYTGSLWIMASGSWQVRILADGSSGPGSLAVPLPSVARATKQMQWGLGSILFILMLLLALGIVLIVGASIREAKLDRGVQPDETLQQRARRAMAISFVVVTAILALGWWWWNTEESNYRRNVFSPLGMQAVLQPSGLLLLTLQDPANVPRDPNVRTRPVFFRRTTDDLVPDHDHLMHLYAIREPGLDVVYHLHPDMDSPGAFRLQLPDMDAGRYRLYADIVHENGFPETLVSKVDVPAGLPGRPLAGDDARGTAAPVGEASDATTFRLPDGYSMQWLQRPGAMHPNRMQSFQFALADSHGRPPKDMRLYMGMLAHAAFLKTDGSAFAHIHPSGSVSMASLMMAQQQLPDHADRAKDDMAGMDMPGMAHSAPAMSAIPNQVSFPYGFPSVGRYRIFVQMKHGDIVETGVFDTQVQ